MEGPFINQRHKGAQNPNIYNNPNFDFIENYTDVIKVISYAPEQDENFEFTKQV